ncbi:hypothetical protein [Acidithiobacillus concretivorus]|uniref:Uncharacterized protein n=1 Tax=Acidithiobacillus concretivorus TaxID=3063952 RepID=A0ABS5ZNY6_9PROT|nr:hypothetical protein [Acidithiobacillus concretivorus]MBU2738325.1 hypothetical protein [Acidithiobacillus concretivorus]
MTYQELVEFLNHHLGYPLLGDLSPAEALASAQNNTLEDPLTAEVLIAIYQGNQCQALSDPVDRAHSFDGLARLRLRAQADDADPFIFRKVLKLSQELDNAFDQELIRQRE